MGKPKGPNMNLQNGANAEEIAIRMAMQETQRAKDMPQTAPELHTAIKEEQPEKNTGAQENGLNKANLKSQKQVFSFRATLEDIADWKTYSIATGEKMENIAAAAMNEYIRNHPLTGAEKAVFEAMKARNEKADL